MTIYLRPGISILRETCVLDRAWTYPTIVDYVKMFAPLVVAKIGLVSRVSIVCEGRNDHKPQAIPSARHYPALATKSHRVVNTPVRSVLRLLIGRPEQVLPRVELLD